MAGPLATAALMTAAFAPLAARATETCAILYLDAHGRLVGARHVAGAVGKLDLPVRTVVADALAFGATRVIMAHNHPSGDPTPSEADVALTGEIARAAEPLGLRVLDHVVIGNGRWISLRQEGQL